MKFSFIDAKKAELPVARLCEKSRETYLPTHPRRSHGEW